MVLASKEFGGCADGRCEVSVVPDHLIQAADDLCVGNVFAVPSKKVVDSVPRGNGDVTGIGCCLLRDYSTFEDLGTELDGLIVDFEDGQVFDGGNPFSGGLRVASSRLFDDQFRNEYGIMTLPGIPPSEGELLLSRQNQIVRGAGGQETRDGGFEVNCGFRTHRAAGGKGGFTESFESGDQSAPGHSQITDIRQLSGWERRAAGWTLGCILGREEEVPSDQ